MADVEVQLACISPHAKTLISPPRRYMYDQSYGLGRWVTLLMMRACEDEPCI